MQQRELQQRELQHRELQHRELQHRELQQRELQQRELQQRELQQRELQQRELQREQEAQELELERHHQHQQGQEQPRPSHETHGNSIPLQHPVASRLPASLHGPNGLLTTQHPGAGASSTIGSVALGASGGPVNAFANGVQPTIQSSPRHFVPQTAQMIPPQQLLGFGNSAGPQQLPTGMTALSQGQQPILNVCDCPFI
jgi:paired amphipathic helix protein Sin3a